MRPSPQAPSSLLLSTKAGVSHERGRLAYTDSCFSSKARVSGEVQRMLASRREAEARKRPKLASYVNHVCDLSRA